LPRDFSTEAVVLGSHKLREADRVVTLFTARSGKTPTVVKGVRKVGSRFGGRLEPFTHLEVRLHEGRSLHTLTGADTRSTHAAIRERPASLNAGLCFIDLLARSSAELEQRPRCFNLLVRFLSELDAVATQADGSASMLTLGAGLKLLLLSGYLPHLSGCAHCGEEAELPFFSAAAGGATCGHCAAEAFPVSAGALEAMRLLLENPLTAASGYELDDAAAREVWRAIREICQYHLSFDPRVSPFYRS